MESNEEKLLFFSFNQDGSCFCTGTDKGFRIYNSYPLKCIKKRDIDGGVGIIEILERCNVMAFVGTGNNPKFSPYKVILWDEKEAKVINELILTYPIKNIKLKRTKIFIVCESKIIVFTLGNYEKIDTIKTSPNKNGIFGISLNSKISLIAYPSPDVGKIIIKNYDEKKNGNYITNEIKAHQNEIVALVMNQEGTLVASASERGTIIKIFQTKDGALIQELRRGAKPAEIYSLTFDYKSLYIACISNQGTTHIFNVKSENNKVENQKSIIGNVYSFFGGVSEYFNSEWSFAQYRLTFYEKSIISFSPDNSPGIIVLTSDGMYHQAQFDPKYGGESSTSIEKKFSDLEIEVED